MFKLKIVHIAPFAPHRCGLYEAARDMIKADIKFGHTVSFIDTGVIEDGKQLPGKVGEVDERTGFKLVTANPGVLYTADLIIMHTGYHDSELVKTQAPIMWVVHGRPLACFRPEVAGAKQAYSLYTALAQWPRTKKMLYLWPEFKPYWDNVFPEGKSVVLDNPVVDDVVFKPEGDKYKFVKPGKVNILICDSSREDIDLFELVSGILYTAKKFKLNEKEVKFHFYGFDKLGKDANGKDKLPKCWSTLLLKLQATGCLGDLAGRISDTDKLYRASDLLISPNRITVRTIAEAMMCGTPVMCESGNKVATYTTHISDLDEFAYRLNTFLDEKQKADLGLTRSIIARIAKDHFGIDKYIEKMYVVYSEIMKKEDK